jgi:hypothetical protein
VAPVQRLQLARTLQQKLRQPLPRWGAITFAVAGYVSPLLFVLGAGVAAAFFQQGEWERAAARARGDSQPATDTLVRWARAFILFHNKRHQSVALFGREL